jgi:hypothetical protein
VERPGWPVHDGRRVITVGVSALLGLIAIGCDNHEPRQVVEAAATEHATPTTEDPATALTNPPTPSTTVEPVSTVPPTTTAPARPRDAAPAPCTESDPEALQRAVEEGHQPWRVDPVAVVNSCVAGEYGWVNPIIEQLAPNTYRATDPLSGQSATVTVARPFHDATIWVVESVAS